LEEAVSQTSPVSETPDIIGVLRSVHSALDDALGDTDVSHIENDDELRNEHPVQWAAFWLAQAIEALEEAKPPVGHAQTPAAPTPIELAIEREEKYLHSLIDDEAVGSVMHGDIEGAFHRLNSALSHSSTPRESESDLREENLRSLLREARQYVSDDFINDDMEVHKHSASLLKDIDAALSISSPVQTREGE
jgi:hypothetical protein